MYRSISSSIFTFITIYGIIYLASAQDSSAKSGDATSKNYVISADGENITFTPFAEDDYITKSPEEKCFLLRYIDDAIYEMLQYVNFKKDPPYGKDIYGESTCDNKLKKLFWTLRSKLYWYGIK